MTLSNSLTSAARHRVFIGLFVPVPRPLLTFVPVFLSVQLHELLQQFFLAGRNEFWDSYFDLYKKVSSAVSPQFWDPFASETNYRPGLGPGGNLQGFCPIQGGYLDHVSEDGLQKGDGDFAVKIVAIALDLRMRGNFDPYVKVASSAAAIAAFTFSPQPQPCPRINSCRHFYLNAFPLPNSPLAMAVPAWGDQHLSGALAPGATRTDPEKPL